ncbi:MAG: hypothetical protein JRC99_01530 [Deltaproteobacteria bacterium]|nr:hypothetical protein [Deltaproteobacteria bacterium]
MKAKLISTMIIILVASGTAIIPLMGDTATGLEPLRALFLAFVTAIIAIQLIPAIMLLGCVFKSVSSSDEKRQER